MTRQKFLWKPNLVYYLIDIKLLNLKFIDAPFLRDGQGHAGQCGQLYNIYEIWNFKKGHHRILNFAILYQLDSIEIDYRL